MKARIATFLSCRRATARCEPVADWACPRGHDSAAIPSLRRAQDMTNLMSDLEILASLDDERSDWRGVGGYVAVRLAHVGRSLVGSAVDVYSQVAQTFTRPSSDGRRVLAHTAREDEHVQATHSRRHGGDFRPQPMKVHSQREAGRLVARLSPGQDDLHVG